MRRARIALAMALLLFACRKRPTPGEPPPSIAITKAPEDAGPPSSPSTTSTPSTTTFVPPPPPPPAKNAPLVRPVRWLCKEQGCEGYPTYAYDYLPAVSADDAFVAYVEERDGWGHTRTPGVRVVAVDTTASIAFFPLVTGADDMNSMATVARRKAEFQKLVDAANAGLAPYAFRPLFPRSEGPACGPGSTDPCQSFLFPDLRIEVQTIEEGAAAGSGTERVIVEHLGKEVARVNAKAWDPLSGCSTRSFGLVGARADARLAVFVSDIVMTGHNCDGVEESQPWAVKIVRW
jgi:hypothetical protein